MLCFVMLVVFLGINFGGVFFIKMDFEFWLIWGVIVLWILFVMFVLFG